jgi:protein-S-isoprenylcysteine O-methyltransferase Ste14
MLAKGLYRWIQHPIVLAAFYFKARREEGFLRQEFGDGFEEYAKRTGMFLPKLG